MHYSKNERLYEIEKMMRGIPNFKERGYGSNIYRNEGKYYIRIVSKQKIEIQCDIMSPKLVLLFL